MDNIVHLRPPTTRQLGWLRTDRCPTCRGVRGKGRAGNETRIASSTGRARRSSFMRPRSWPGNSSKARLQPTCQSPLGLAHAGLGRSARPPAPGMVPSSAARTTRDVSMSPLPVQSTTSMIWTERAGRGRGRRPGCRAGLGGSPGKGHTAAAVTGERGGERVGAGKQPRRHRSSCSGGGAARGRQQRGRRRREHVTRMAAAGTG